MQTVSSIYLEGMGEMVRRPSRMRLTFHYPTGDIIYTNRDIVNVTEKKTAHLIAGELPAVELEMELVNLDGSFNPNDISGLHDLIVKGVPVTYEFGYDIPNLQYYGYTDDGEEHDYGMDENVPYGFMEGYATEWIPGGEVVTSGEISYSKTTATISAKDHLSFLDEHVLLAYGNRTLAQVAKAVLNLTDYPKEDDGDPKIITGPELDAFSTAITLSETEDDSISAKEHLQTIAHACGVQMYIDRAGYIHLDNDKRGVGAVYSLPLGQQGETPEHRKEQMPKKVVITLNSEYGDPVETDLNGGGETMTVENPFIVTTAEGETLSGIVYDHFIKYRNTADIPYRGEPALDILDTITLGTEFGGDVEAIVVGTELQFDGTLSGSLSVRYQLGGNTPEKVQIKGSGNFIYPLGEEDEPSITSFDLVCDTTFDTPTYQWSYFTVSNGSWLNIAGATSNTLTVAYNSPYYDNDSSVKFRCVVNGVKGAITQISKIQLQKSETAGYRGVQKKATKEEIDVPSPQIGDVVLLDNTDNEDADVYGEAHVYDGEKWVSTEESDALAMTYKDALELAELSEKTIYASKIFTDLLVANKGFITNLFAQNATITGILKSDNYSETGGIPTEGFKLDGPNSIVKMFEAVFGNQCTFYGKLLHSLLQTREAVSADSITIPEKTHWTRQSFIDFLTSKSLPSNALVPCTGTYDGTTITHVIKATGTNIRLFTLQSLNASTSFAVPFNGTVYLYAKGIDAITYTAYVNYNGVRQVYSDSASVSAKTISVSKNGTLYGFSASSAVIAYADLVLPSSGYFLILSNGAIVKIEEYSDLSLSVTYGGTTWNSSSYLNYVTGSAILALLTSLSQGVMLSATGTLVIDGTSRSIVSIFSQVSSVLLYWDSTNHKEVLSTGYYDISGSFTPESVTAAVLTDILLPLVPADNEGNGKDIGTPVDKYRAVHARSVNTDTINTGGLGDFLIGQNLRTTDSPTFATVNATNVVTTNGPNKPVDNNDASMPSVGIGGFSYAYHSRSKSGTPSITIGSGGTWVYIAQSTRDDSTRTEIGRIAGGARIYAQYAATSSYDAYLYVIAWRIA